MLSLCCGAASACQEINGQNVSLAIVGPGVPFKTLDQAAVQAYVDLLGDGDGAIAEAPAAEAMEES